MQLDFRGPPGGQMVLENLSPEVRVEMTAEVQSDIDAGRLFLSPRLRKPGEEDYPRLLLEAVATHDIRWLVSELNKGGRLASSESYLRGGRYFTRRVPSNAAEMIAEGEFNRFYCRGLCRMLLSTLDSAEVEVYRAKRVDEPRRESQRLIGKRLPAAAVLADLRMNSSGVDTVLGVPAGPNSGLSVRVVAG